MNPYIEHLDFLLRSADRRYRIETNEEGCDDCGEYDNVKNEEIRKVRNAILTKIEATESLPSLPGIVERLESVLGDPRSNAKDIAATLKLDSGLAAQMLRLVNSSVFGLPRKVNGLDQAVVLLGINQVRSLAMTASVLSVFPASATDAFDPRRYWEHSLTVALGCRHIARALSEKGVEGIECEDAFLCGLLHDVGKILIAQLYAEKVMCIHGLVQDHSLPLEEAELEILGVRHADIGRRLLARWNIRPQIVAAVGDHHYPSADGVLGQIVHLADQISRGLGFSADSAAMPHVDPAIWEWLDLADDVIEGVAFQVLRDFEEATALLDGRPDLGPPQARRMAPPPRASLQHVAG